MKAFLVLLAIFAIANAANVGIAHIKGTSLDAGITGTAYFVQLNETYHWVWVSVSGITVNPELQHGVHVHTWGDVTDQAAATSAGGHYIGGGSLTHQCEDNDTRHQGDMGNWQATGGNITFSKTLNLLASTGGNSIIGRSIVIHQLADNCTAQPLGAAGTRLAFGVIGISNPMLWPQAVLTALGLTNYTANGAVSGATDVTRAVAVLRATAVNPAFASLVGNVTFEQDATSGDVTVTGIFSGLTAGQGFGLHIHLYGDYSVNATAVSDHFGAGIVAHGGPNNDTRHYGDLGNICSFDSTGIAYYRWVMTDDKFTLSGANSILGRSVVVHAVYDTMRPSSAFGARIAQGVIGAANATNAPIITIPTGFNVSDPICASVAPTPSPATTTTATATTTTNAATTNAATTRPATSTTGASSSASFVAVCFTAVIALFAVVLF